MFLLISVGMVAYNIQLVRQILKKTEDVQKYVKRSKKWPSTSAIIQSISINADYPWPSLTFKGEAIPDIAKKREESLDTDIGSGIRIEYSYSIQDVEYTAKTIQIVPINNMLDFAHSIRVGQKVPVFYNSKNHEESYLVETKEQDVGEYTWILLQDARAPIFICGASIIFTFILFLIA